MILSIEDGANYHIFAYQPVQNELDAGLPLTRLTSGPWDDINPSISPDGKRVAFASNRSGYWDIYLFDLESVTVTRLTDTLAYDDAPSWSPDGQWLAYQTYLDNNLEIVIHSVVDTASPAIRLTKNAAADYQPAWSPQGREMAFVSNRSGKPEIYTADLNQVDEKLFKQITAASGVQPSHPAWSPDGSRMAWAEEQDGLRRIRIWDITQPIETSILVGNGNWPAWGAGGQIVYTIVPGPNAAYLSMFKPNQPGVFTPLLPLPANVQGLSWSDQAVLSLPLSAPILQSAQQTPQPLFKVAITTTTPIPGGRQTLVKLEDVQAPFPMLQDQVVDSFRALRRDLAQRIGWDYLASLENAYVPLTSPLPPGAGDSWLYTGRAFGSNSQLVNAGWMKVVREDFGSEVYWRIYLLARYQDGSAGIPVFVYPWNFLSRYENDTSAYEAGGKLETETPAGYWFDFTAFAERYGWRREPALTNWLTDYSAARFNEFANTGDLDWRQAMLEIYPPEVFLTPSPVLPPTATLTPTYRWYQSPTPTATMTPRPTLTPLPSATTVPPTSTPTSTPTPTRPAATSTSTATSTTTP